MTGNHHATKARILDAARPFMRDQRGAGMMEYLVLVGFVGLAAMLGFRAFGNQVNRKVIEQADAISNISAAPGTE